MTFSRTNEKQFFADIQERLTKLERGLRQVPLNQPKRGGSGGTGLVVARIIGGNASMGTGSDAPLGRLFVHSVNYSNSDGELFETPIVDAWTNYPDLDLDYEIGAKKIPRQPTGIGFAQILRPYSLGGKIWSNNAEWLVLASGTPVMNTATIGTDKKTIIITGSDKTITKITTPIITVTKNTTPLVIESIATKTAGATIVLETAVTDFNGLVVSWDDDAFNAGAVSVAAGSLSISPVGDYYTIVRVLNNTGSQGFSFGSYVILDNTSVDVEDNASVVKQCYRILTPASMAVPHNHSGLGATGQGRVVYLA